MSGWKLMRWGRLGGLVGIVEWERGVLGAGFGVFGGIEVLHGHVLLGVR